MLSHIHQQFYEKLSHILDTQHWKFYIVSLSVCSILFFSFPYYKRITDELQQKPDRYLKWQQLKAHAAHPFTQIEAPPNSHQAKLTFRLTMPLLMRALQYNIVAFYLCQALLGIAFCWILADFSYKQFNNKILAGYITFGVANIYAGASFFVDTLASYDPFAYFFLLAAIAYRNPFSIFFMVQLAAWTDERGLIASCFVYLFWLLNLHDFSKNLNFSSLFKFSPQLIAIMGSWLIYLGFRFGLGYFMDLHAPLGHIGLNIFIENIKLSAIGAWTGLEGFWLLIVILTTVLLYTKDYLLLLLLTFGALLISFTAMIVYDITRSISHLYLLIPISCYILYRKIGEKELYKVILACAVISFLFPLYFVKDNMTYMEPIYLRVLEFIAK